jgi:hypothetical protein
MVGVAVDLDVAADAEFTRGDPIVVLVHVLVLVAAQEGSLDDTRVLDGGLIDRDAVVLQVERDDEAAVDILGNAGVESGGVAEDLLVVVNRLEEVTFRLLGDQVVDVAESVDFVSEPVVGRDLAHSGLRGLGHLDCAHFENAAEFGHEELLGVLIDTVDIVVSVESADWLVGVDLISGQVVVTNEVETGLVNVTSEWESLALEELGEGVAAIVGVVHLTDLTGIVSQVVVHNEGKVFTAAEEAENFAVIVEELLPGGDFTTTGSEGLLHVFLHVIVTWAGNLDQGVVEGVNWDVLALGLGVP